MTYNVFGGTLNLALSIFHAVYFGSAFLQTVSLQIMRRRPRFLFSFIANLMQCLFFVHQESSMRYTRPNERDDLKREYHQNCSVLGCVTQCSQSAAHLCEQFLQVQQIRFVTLGPLRHAYRRLPRVVLL